MIFIVLLVFAAVAVAFAAAMRGPASSRPRRRPLAPMDADITLDDESPADLSLSDPVEALLRHGTPADAARLAEQGVDLAALGYRPPGAR